MSARGNVVRQGSGALGLLPKTMTTRRTLRHFSRLLLATAALAAFALAFAVTHATAGSSTQSITIAHGAEAIVLADGRISIEQAVKMAEQKFKARVVRAESQDEGGKTVYVLRLLNESGRVWTVRVDAVTGSVI
jgi:uncharacterized membrane protein YkoI